MHWYVTFSIIYIKKNTKYPIVRQWLNKCDVIVKYWAVVKYMQLYAYKQILC